MKILVTGASGFIGTYLVRRLEKLGYNVFGIDEKTLDIRNREAVKTFFKKRRFDTVFHLASLLPGFPQDHTFDAYMRVNGFGTLYLLEAAAKTHVKRFIYSSSVSVYSCSQTPMPAKELYAAPESFYGLSKFIGERLCEIVRKATGLSTVSLRYSSVYGFGQKPNSVLAIFLMRALQNRDLQIQGTGKRTQDFVYVEDVVSANLKAAFSSKVEGVFNIGSGQEISVQELAEIILRVFSESKSRIKKIQASEKQNEERFALDMQRTKKELGFTPKFTLVKGLSDYKKNIYEKNA